jgi:hypothetical protein
MNIARIIYSVVLLLFALGLWMSEIERAMQKRAINLVFHARAAAVTNSIIQIKSDAPMMDTLNKMGFGESNRIFSPAMEIIRIHPAGMSNGVLMAAMKRLDALGYKQGGLLSQRRFSAALEQISTDGCPADFKDAWNSYVAAWKTHCSFSEDDRLFSLAKANPTEGLKFGAVNMQDNHKDVESAWIKCEYFASTYYAVDTSDFDF